MLNLFLIIKVLPKDSILFEFLGKFFSHYIKNGVCTHVYPKCMFIGIIIYGVIFESFVFRLLKSYPGIRLNSYSWVSSFHVAVYSTQRLLRGGPFGKDHGDGRRWPGNGKLYGQRGGKPS